MSLDEFIIQIKETPHISTVVRKPIIGIIAKHDEKGSLFPEGNQFSFVSDDLTSAISENGGIPMVIPSINKEITYGNNDSDYNLIPDIEKENLIALIKMTDGIILQGGKESDSYEIFVAKYCYDNDIPIIGICAGQNNLARAAGGKSRPLTDNKEKHNSGFNLLAHPITVAKDSKFYKMVDGNSSFRINSIHTNVIDENSLENTDLVAVAWDDDGNIEVIERKDNEKSPYIGIRFHPESLTKDLEVGKIMNGIFSNFINFCREKKRGVNAIEDR